MRVRYSTRWATRSLACIKRSGSWKSSIDSEAVATTEQRAVDLEVEIDRLKVDLGESERQLGELQEETDDLHHQLDDLQIN
ncbi:hypothetical protein B296_00057005 [Ensete ventricosum]|uniref:Uncharacterized protein n=1 Tax=Ensete ventricosum TaxID=4639 RepID=A0A426XT12_ENSVE|nr:hypothetical protein B296_00057005 [Ensete ventricosum]